MGIGRLSGPGPHNLPQLSLSLCSRPAFPNLKQTKVVSALRLTQLLFSLPEYLCRDGSGLSSSETSSDRASLIPNGKLLATPLYCPGSCSIAPTYYQSHKHYISFLFVVLPTSEC